MHKATTIKAGAELPSLYMLFSPKAFAIIGALLFLTRVLLFISILQLPKGLEAMEYIWQPYFINDFIILFIVELFAYTALGYAGAYLYNFFLKKNYIFNDIFLPSQFDKPSMLKALFAIGITAAIVLLIQDCMSLSESVGFGSLFMGLLIYTLVLTVLYLSALMIFIWISLGSYNQIIHRFGDMSHEPLRLNGLYLPLVLLLIATVHTLLYWFIEQYVLSYGARYFLMQLLPSNSIFSLQTGVSIISLFFIAPLYNYFFIQKRHYHGQQNYRRRKAFEGINRITESSSV